MDISQALLSTILILTAYHNQRLQPIHTMDWNSKCGTVQSRSLSQRRGRGRKFPRYYIEQTRDIETDQAKQTRLDDRIDIFSKEITAARNT